MGGPSSLGPGLAGSLPRIPAPICLNLGFLPPAPGLVRLGSSPPSPLLPVLLFPSPPPSFACLLFPSIHLKGRKHPPEFPYQGHTQCSSSRGRGPFQSLEPLLTSRGLECLWGGELEVVVARAGEITSWQAHMGQGGTVCEHRPLPGRPRHRRGSQRDLIVNE